MCGICMGKIVQTITKELNEAFHVFHNFLFEPFIDLASSINWGAWWRSGRVSDSEYRGPGFDPTSGSMLCP